MTNNEINAPDTAPADQDWFGGRRWTGIAAVGFVILIVLCVVIVVVINRGGGNSANPAPTATPPVTSSATASVSSQSAVLPTVIPTAAPVGARWTLFESVAVPTVDGVGPRSVNGAIATGYAHSPEGALVAMANTTTRFFLASDSQWRAAAAAMLAHSGGYNAWLKKRATVTLGPGGATNDGQHYTQFAAFQFVSYTVDAAVIQIVTRDESGTLQLVSATVVWANNDWKLVLAPDGGVAATIQQIDDLTGFIEWRGV